MKRYAGLDANNELLAKTEGVVPWAVGSGVAASGQVAQVAGGARAVGRGGDV